MIDYIVFLIARIIDRIDYIERKNNRTVLRNLLGEWRYFCLKNWIEISKSRKYSTKSSFLKKKQRLQRIVLVFDGTVINVGLADRLRAMTSVYHWCKNNQIELKIYFEYPFCLKDYLKPNKYDWLITDSELSKNDCLKKSLISFSDLFGEKNNNVFHRRFLDTLLTSGNKTIHLYTNTCCYDESFYQDFHDLFVTDVSLENEIQSFLAEIDGKFISLSFRFAQLLGDLEDTYGEPLSDDLKAELLEKCVKSIKPLLYENGVDKCIVTSDSCSFLQDVSKLPFVYIIPGTVGHIRNKVTEDQVRKTFWDMLMISQAQKAYMVRTPIMYRSSFAKRAAMINNVPFEELVIE